MHHLQVVLLELRILKFPALKSYSVLSPVLCNYITLKVQNIVCLKFPNTLKYDFKQRNYSILYSCPVNCMQHRYLCSAVQNMKNDSNKIITLLESKEFEVKNKLDVKLFFNSVCESKELSVVEWDSLKEELLKSSTIFNAINFNGLVMKNLLLKNNYLLACSFMKFLEAKHVEPNLFTLSTFMKLCGQNIEKCGEDHIINMYCKVKDLKVMDSTLMENIICSLSVTSYWKEGYKIYKEAEICVPLLALNSLACAAFRYHNFEVALELVMEIEKFANNDWNHVYIEWLNAVSNIHLSSPQESNSLLDKFLSHICSKEIIVSQEVAELISIHFKSLKDEDWNSTFITMARKRTCPNCSQPLKLIEITNDQYQLLKEVVLSKVVKGSDVFLNTTPAELERFSQFLKSTVPYDIVLDGLNIAYYYLHNSSNSERAHQLYLVVNHFANQNKMKTLVIGREHMKKWPEKYMKPISKMAKIFYADNISKDDPFILYAALVSGPQTMVLTKDLLRNHKFWLQDPLLSIYFEYWRKSHQIFLTRVNTSGIIIYEEPLPYSIIAQGSMEEGWHIPYTLLNNNKPKSVYDFHKNWLCIRKL